jgi:hypothetical protein
MSDAARSTGRCALPQNPMRGDLDAQHQQMRRQLPETRRPRGRDARSPVADLQGREYRQEAHRARFQHRDRAVVTAAPEQPCRQTERQRR